MCNENVAEKSQKVQPHKSYGNALKVETCTPTVA